MLTGYITLRRRGAGLTGHQHNGGGGSVGLGEAPQALAQLVVSGILGRGVDVCDGNLGEPSRGDSEERRGTALHSG